MTTPTGPVVCAWCDDTCDTIAEARRRKWTGILDDADGLSWNAVGTCPVCRKEYEDVTVQTKPTLFEGESP